MTVTPLQINTSELIRTLENTPRNEWSTSRKVSGLFLSCKRLGGMIAKLMIKRGIQRNHHTDIYSEVVMIMQMKMLDRLDEPSNVYYVAHKVSMLVIFNWGKKEQNTFFSKEVSLNEFKFDEENEQDLMDKLNVSNGYVNDGIEAERDLDRRLARERLTKKINTIGWPKGIPRERKKIGRPSKKSDQPSELQESSSE
jgi:hypothetical protein